MTNHPPLPPGWEWTTIGEITDPERKRVKPQDYPHLDFVGMDNIEAHTMRLLGTVPASEMRSTVEYFEPDDVLYGRLRPYLNKVFRADFEGLCSSEFIAFRKVPHLASKYLQYFLNSSEFVAFASSLNTGDRPRVNFSQIADHPFPLPPLAEQRRIVEAIETQFTRLEAGLASLRQAQARLERYQASVLKAACEGRLVPQEHKLAHQDGRNYETAKELVATLPKVEIKRKRRAGRLWGAGVVPELSEKQKKKIPRGWQWVKVNELGSDPDEVVQVGPMSMKSREFENTGVPVFNVGCVRRGYFDESKLNFLPPDKAERFDRYRIQPNDILFTRSGYVGRCAIAIERHKNWLMTFHLLRVRVNSEVCLPKYLHTVFEGAPHIKKQIDDATIGTTRKGFNTRLLATLDVPLPPLAEQRRIVAEVERRLSVVAEVGAAIEANLKRADRLRQAILKRAFAGRLVPQDPADEPAAVLLGRIRAAKEKKKRGRQLELSGV
jgi:type I restriction enzyme S subunit